MKITATSDPDCLKIASPIWIRVLGLFSTAFGLVFVVILAATWLGVIQQAGAPAGKLLPVLIGSGFLAVGIMLLASPTSITINRRTGVLTSWYLIRWPRETDLSRFNSLQLERFWYSGKSGRPGWHYNVSLIPADKSHHPLQLGEHLPEEAARKNIVRLAEFLNLPITEVSP